VDKRINLESRLPQAVTQVNMTEWPAPVIQLFLGQLTPADVLAAAASPDAKKMKGQICEANFFNGERALERNAIDEAARLFGLAAAECPKRFFERAAAIAELRALGMKP
jgi:lipoprotein NlpI